MFDDIKFKETIIEIVDKNFNKVFPEILPDYTGGMILSDEWTGPVRLMSFGPCKNFFIELNVSNRLSVEINNPEDEEELSRHYCHIDQNLHTELMRMKAYGKKEAEDAGLPPEFIAVKRMWHKVVFKKYENIDKQIFAINVPYCIDIIDTENPNEKTEDVA